MTVPNIFDPHWGWGGEPAPPDSFPIADYPVPGFYVAHHRQMDPIYGPGRCHKVGYTANLRRRLRDSAYYTCFAGKFSYVLTVETTNAKEAKLFQEALLKKVIDRRYMRENGFLSELVQMTETTARSDRRTPF